LWWMLTRTPVKRKFSFQTDSHNKGTAGEKIRKSSLNRHRYFCGKWIGWTRGDWHVWIYRKSYMPTVRSKILTKSFGFLKTNPWRRFSISKYWTNHTKDWVTWNRMFKCASFSHSFAGFNIFSQPFIRISPAAIDFPIYINSIILWAFGRYRKSTIK
jgi:hypothetical protein